MSENNDMISKYGQIVLDCNDDNIKIHLLSIIGEIEGHDLAGNNVKTTKYEHILPQLVGVCNDSSIDGLLILINTVGGDVSAGLAIAEMIASINKPKVALVIGDSHSIGVPLAVAADYSFIVPSGTMIIHPVRLSGTVIGAPQTYEYFKLIEDRIVSFIADHSNAEKNKITEMMITKGLLTKDLGTILVGKQAVEKGLINEVGGICDAINQLKQMISKQ
ncbi:MAG: Clp protease [Lachnospiraceae bacterium]|nr:Clp protease [Lachnospiraceae bacterium]